jgi:hypothetical protein
MIQNDMTPEEQEKALGLVVATDKCMSGWGMAQHTSYVATPYFSEDDLQKVLNHLHRRSEMLRVRIVSKKYRPKLRAGDHLHIYDGTAFRRAI